MMNYRENPFYVLAVSPRSSKSDIVAAYEDAVLDHPDERTGLAEARQNILISRRRLEWELRWFPETDPNEIAKALANFEGSGDAQPSKFAGLSEINFAAYHRRNIAEVHVQLAELFGALDPEEARNAINQDRDTAGFTQVDQSNFEIEWKKLRGDLVKCVLDAVSNMAQPGEAMLRLVHSAEDNSQATRAFVQEVVLRFDEWSAPKLSQLEKAIEDKLASGTKLSPRDVKALVEKLRKWNKFREPVQLQLSKIDAEDERSLKVLGIFADALNSDDKRGDIDAERELVLILFPLMLKVFQGLPSAKGFLVGLEEHTTNARVFVDFDVALSTANQERLTFISQLKNGQFRAKGNGIAGKLFLSARTMHDMDGAEHSRAVWVGLINLVGELLNEGREPGALRTITRGLRSFGPPPDAECKTEIDNLEGYILLVEAHQKHHGLRTYNSQYTDESGPSWFGWVVFLVFILFAMSQCS